MNETVFLAVVFGLLTGSFLNVVVYRLPVMLNRAWRCQCEELLNAAPAPAGAVESGSAGGAEQQPEQPFNLLVPRSRCGVCNHQIRWYENIPILSYLFLRGRCSGCRTGIGLRYPLVELLTGLLFGYAAWRWGYSFTTVLWCLCLAAWVALFFIDWDTTLLPDSITLPLLWLGLLAAALGLNPLVKDLSDAVYGAAAGYLSLWSVYWAFKIVTGKEGMGYGDFKLLAALCAWMGLQALVPVLLLSSVVGAVGGILIKMTGGLREGGYMPYGPFLIGAGLLVLWLGTDVLEKLL